MNELELEKYRKEIVKIDEKIFQLLESRFEIVRKVGDFKKENNLPVRNKKREQDLIEKMSEKYSMDKNFIAKFYRVIFNNSYEIEK